jgi:hypothetical protein
MQDGLTRQQLDIALLVAEAELVEGLPTYPAPFPVSQSDAELSSFKLRRVECMASSHAAARGGIIDRLQLLEVSDICCCCCCCCCSLRDSDRG